MYTSVSFVEVQHVVGSTRLMVETVSGLYTSPKVMQSMAVVILICFGFD